MIEVFLLVSGVAGGFVASYVYFKYILKNISPTIKRRGKPRSSVDTLLTKTENDEKEVLEIVSKIAPEWLLSPDHSSSEWLNEILKISWPTIKIYASNLIHDSLYQQIDHYLSGYLGNTHIIHFHLGHTPPRFDGIKVMGNRSAKDILIVDVHLIYHGDASIELEFNRIPLGIEGIFLRTKLRITLQLDQTIPPFASGLDISLVTVPTIQYELTGILNVIELPGIKEQFDKLLNHTFETYLVFPHKIYIPFGPAEERRKYFESKKFRVLSIYFEQDPKIKRKLYGRLEFNNKDYKISIGETRPFSHKSEELILLIRTFMDTSSKLEFYENQRFRIDRKILYSLLSFRNLYQNNTKVTDLKVIEYHDKKYANDIDPNIKCYLRWLSLCDKKPDKTSQDITVSPIYDRYSVVTLKLFSIKGAFKNDFSSSDPVIPVLKVEYLDNVEEFKDLLWTENVIDIYDVVDFLIDHGKLLPKPINITVMNKSTNETMGIAKLNIFNNKGEFIHNNVNNKVSLYNSKQIECDLFLNVHYYYICSRDSPDSDCEEECAPDENDVCVVDPVESVDDLPHSLLHIDIIRGRNLTAHDTSLFEDSSDPYVMISVGDYTNSTKFINKSLNPIWNEQISIVVPHSYLSGKLTFTVNDHDDVTTDDLIGSVSMFVFDELENKDKEPKWYPLSNNGGEIQLKIEFVPIHVVDIWKPQKQLIMCFYIRQIQIINKEGFKNKYRLVVDQLTNDPKSNEPITDKRSHRFTAYVNCKDKTMVFNEWIYLTVVTTSTSSLQFTMVSDNKDKIKGSTIVELNKLTTSDSSSTLDTNSLYSSTGSVRSDNNINEQEINPLENPQANHSNSSKNRPAVKKSVSADRLSTNFDPVYNDCKHSQKMLKKEGKNVAWLSYKVFFGTH